MWLPRFACPACRGSLAESMSEAMSCTSCGLTYRRDRGIYRFLTPVLAERAAPFVTQYRQVRERDGYRALSADDYRTLPDVAADNPHAGEWRLRRASYARLLCDALPATGSAAMRVLDLGAGCGWLSHRLATLGHHVVAVDRLDDEADGLGACRYYDVPLTAVQADFDHLPFAPGQFDLAVFEGTLHYAPDPRATLEETRRVLTSGGTIVVMDSPVFAREADGQAMVASLLGGIAETHGAPAVRPGVGFVTYRGMDEAFASLGLRSRFHRSHGSLGWRLRRQIGRIRLGRAPAAFGVWIAKST